MRLNVFSLTIPPEKSRRVRIGLVFTYAVVVASWGLGHVLGFQRHGSPQQNLPVEEIRIGPPGQEVSLSVEVASTSRERERGLMGRVFLAQDHGMLFVFHKPRKVCFWMHDTLIPLSLAFVGVDKKISGLSEMRAMSDTLHCSPSRVLYGIEAGQGWFSAHGVQRGQEIELPH